MDGSLRNPLFSCSSGDIFKIMSKYYFIQPTDQALASGSSALRLLPFFPLLLLLLLLLSACSSQVPGDADAPKMEPLYWPAPPQQPRIEWVKEIRIFNRGGLNPGFWHKLSEGLFGRQDIGLRRPQAVLFDAKQRLFVVDSGAGMIHWLDMNSGKYTVLPEDENEAFFSLVGIAEDDVDRIYVTDSEQGKIFRYDLSDKNFSSFASTMSRPTGIVFNPANKFLYVTETGSHQVVVFDLNGDEQFRFGDRGNEKGMFNFPTHIAVDRQGQVLVTDSLNARVQIFSPEGGYLCSFGQAGDSSGTFAKPKGVAVDSDNNIYVADALFDAIQVFGPCGEQLLLAFGQSGAKPGEFWMPNGIFIDVNDFIYVADSYNQRVQVFRYLKEGEKEKRVEGKK